MLKISSESVIWGGTMNDYYILTDSEVIELRNDFKQAMEKLRVLLDEDVWYNVPRGLSREERRKWISDIGNKLLTQNSEKGKLANEWLVF